MDYDIQDCTFQGFPGAVLWPWHAVGGDRPSWPRRLMNNEVL